MARNYPSYSIFPLPDSEVVEGIEKLANEVVAKWGDLKCPLPGDPAKATIEFNGPDWAFKVDVGASDQVLDSLRHSQGDLIRAAILSVPFQDQSALQVKIVRPTPERVDQAETHVGFTIPKAVEPHTVRILTTLTAWAQALLLARISRSEQERIRGEAKAEVIELLEENVARLERANTTIIEKLLEQRTELDREAKEHEEGRQKEFEALKRKHEEEWSEKNQAIDARRQELESRLNQIDDREPTHVRRQNVGAQQEEIEELLANPRQAVLPAALSLGVLSVMFVAAFTGLYLSAQNASLVNSTDWVPSLRLGLSVAVVIGVGVYIVRWIDAWSRANTDETLRLKHLRLDVQRAAWVTELMLEWNEKKEGPAPDLLLERLTHGLFSPPTTRSPARHPTESALLNAIAAAEGIEATQAIRN
jgi:hypothetical protein